MENNSVKKDIKIKKPVCYVCKKKVHLAFVECKCGEILCINHRYIDSHDCKYDHRSEWNELLRKKNPVIEHVKFEKI